jgi:hypothetical protein
MIKQRCLGGPDLGRDVHEAFAASSRRLQQRREWPNVGADQAAEIHEPSIALYAAV